MRAFGCAALLIALVSGCHLFDAHDGGGVACTREFRTYDVVVTDAQGAPQADVRVEVERLATGRLINCPIEGGRGCVQPGTGRAYDGTVDGRYLVMSDAVPVSRRGERFEVRAQKEASAASATLAFRFDGCHVDAIAGLDTLRLAP